MEDQRNYADRAAVAGGYYDRAGPGLSGLTAPGKPAEGRTGDMTMRVTEINHRLATTTKRLHAITAGHVGAPPLDGPANRVQEPRPVRSGALGTLENELVTTGQLLDLLEAVISRLEEGLHHG